MSHDPKAHVGEVREVLERHHVYASDIVVIAYPVSEDGWSACTFIYHGDKEVAYISGFYPLASLLDAIRGHGYRRVRVAPKQGPGVKLYLADLKPRLSAA